MNAFDTLQEAINEARQVKNASRAHAVAMARLLIGNLSSCDNDTLCRLKSELALYNRHTGKWRLPK